MGLGVSHSEIDPRAAQEMFDDYEIRVVSQTPQLRKDKLSQLIARYDRIPMGDEGAADFEDWCVDALRKHTITLRARKEPPRTAPTAVAVEDLPLLHRSCSRRT